MAVFKAKSKDNISAANFLHGMELYAPSIHCSYYSCLQLSKCLLNTKGKDYNTQDAECKALKHDSHNYIINNTKGYISDSLTYLRNMRTMKALRVKADYGIPHVTPQDATKALSIAKTTITIIGI